MQRKIESKTRSQLFVEHIVWNAAAGAALAVMVLLLLVSLHWLDRIAPSPSLARRPEDKPIEIARPAVASEGTATRIVEALGPRR